MRITSDTLNRIARDTVARRTRSDRDLLAIYLHGSLLEGDPLFGGTADIDLVFIHNDGVTGRREIKMLSDEVHLDIAHHPRGDYRQTRLLRMHPWLGPTIFSCKILYDPQHFMDFTQASVGGQFNRPDYVYARAHGLAEHARQIWLELNALSSQPSLQEVAKYLRAVEHAANAIASLSGPPLTERRFLLHFPGRAEVVDRPGLYPGLLGLLGGAQIEAQMLGAWLPAWQADYEALAEDAPPRLHPGRLYYYLRALEKILASERPQDVLWPLLNTWAQARLLLPADYPDSPVWMEAFQQLGLNGPAFAQKIAALDAYLDTVEETLEDWARIHGA